MAKLNKTQTVAAMLRGAKLMMAPYRGDASPASAWLVLPDSGLTPDVNMAAARGIAQWATLAAKDRHAQTFVHPLAVIGPYCRQHAKSEQARAWADGVMAAYGTEHAGKVTEA